MSDPFDLHGKIPSDHLANLRLLAMKFPPFAAISGNLETLKLVIDSSFILSDLIWLTKNRRNPSARTGLQEVLASGTIVLYAPTKVKDELESKLPDISLREGISEECLRREWEAYQKLLSFCDPDAIEGGQHLNARDPNDIPFVCLYAQLNAEAVISRDKDIASMGAPIVDSSFILHLRDYSRAKSVELALTLMPTLLIAVFAKVLAEAVASTLRSFARLPDGLKLLIVLGIVTAILHPKSRKAISNSLLLAHEKLKPFAADILPMLTEIPLSERVKAEQSWEHARKFLHSK